MSKDCMIKDNVCNTDCSKSCSCKTPKHSNKSCSCTEKPVKTKKSCTSSSKPSCPLFVYPVDFCDYQTYNLLCNCIGKLVGLKLEDSDCILRLRICQVNQCVVMGKTSSGKGPIYVKISSIQYIDLGKEVYVNPLCNTGVSGSVKGNIGIQGPAGPKGEKGDKGDKGPKGDIGSQGPKGDKGDKGDMGPNGPKGDKGDKGDMGPNGPKGDKGDKGDMGPNGPKGDKGPKGDVGPQGSKGDKGDMGLQGPKGDKGDVGSQGPQGPAGTPAPLPKQNSPEYEKYIPPKKVPYKK